MSSQWIQTDLSDPASIEVALDRATGTFDALINNAGLPPREGLEQAILQVNYFGMRAFSTGMLDKLDHGAPIVNTASRAGAMWRDNLDEIKALMALDPADLSDFMAARSMDATRAYNLSKEAVIVLNHGTDRGHDPTGCADEFGQSGGREHGDIGRFHQGLWTQSCQEHRAGRAAWNARGNCRYHSIFNLAAKRMDQRPRHHNRWRYERHGND